jgi:hypothetical protein
MRRIGPMSVSAGPIVSCESVEILTMYLTFGRRESATPIDRDAWAFVPHMALARVLDSQSSKDTLAKPTDVWLLDIRRRTGMDQL